MEKKKITIRPLGGKTAKPVVEEPAAVEVVESGKESSDQSKELRVKKCAFCQSKTIPTYTDIATLKRYLSDRSKIQPKMRSGVCAKHQRAVSRNIKYGRHLALLPFVPKV